MHDVNQHQKYKKCQNINKGRFFYWPLLFIIVAFSIYSTYEPEHYVVVLDPGHGGRDILPKNIYGDKYDPIIGEYRDHFRPGAQNKGITESEEVYKIAEKTAKILELTYTNEGKKKFEILLKKYAPDLKKINWEAHKPIKVHLSRVNNHTEEYISKRVDVNAPYRLYDYPDIYTGEMKKGTISRINSLSPNLVVSLHFTSGRKEKYGALASVITPNFDVYKQAITYVKTKNISKKQKIRRKFFASKYLNWMVTNSSRTHFQWFLCDAWIYFTGYWSKKDGLSPDTKKFRGYRHNMISWQYADKGNWVDIAKNHPDNSSYSINLENFIPEGPFWEREMDIPEKWRREDGKEGYGGDNLYASEELLRYIKKSFILNKVSSKKTAPRILNPYISTWSVPTYLNAISAYLELGFLDNPYDRKRILNNKDEYAEGLAVGIFSLFYSLDIKKIESEKDEPKGEPIDFFRYENYKGKNYFKTVQSGLN
ncbi:MAG: N-acetylmuramoyl-L-alanine amidase [Spirochaetia bacterium]|nr:N-acetylmuramoyl-L-alanine amidase [Spirochaetia bacterium]